MEIYKKRLVLNKIRVWIERFLTDAFCIIGMLAVLSWSIGVFNEAFGYWFDSKEISIVNQSNVAIVSAGAPVSDGNLGESKSQVASPLSAIVDKVYQLESSSGKQDSPACTKLGKHNGYGYGIYASNVSCFDSDSDARKSVEKWFSDKLENGYTLNEAVCYYQSGLKVNSCNYLSRFNSI
jgi:hypothetical protein